MLCLLFSYLHRLGLKLDDYSEVVQQQHKKGLRWMVSNDKTEEFADEVVQNSPELQRFLGTQSDVTQ
jgi:hypothetical protein